MKTRLGWCALTCADGIVLVADVPDGSQLLTGLRAPHAWLAAAGTDAVVAELAGAALWVAAAWLALGLTSLAASRLPGAAGRCGRRVTRAVLPQAIYRLVAGVTGVGIALAPAAGAAAPSVGARATAHSNPAPTTPPSPTPPSPTPPSPTPPSPTPPSPTWPTDPAPSSTKPPAGGVVVHPGDSLWSIAAAHLPAASSPARIARTWPRWYAANRRIIGPNPDLILPGQVLRTPRDIPTASPERSS